MKPQREFVNRVVKQGNSLCVRIPYTIKNELNLREGEYVLVSIFPQEYLFEYDEKTIQYILNITKKIKKLNKYSEIKQRFFIVLNFQFLRETTTKDPKEERKRQIKFIKEKKKEFGSKLINEFIDWGITFKKEVLITEKDGAIIFKPVVFKSQNIDNA